MRAFAGMVVVGLSGSAGLVAGQTAVPCGAPRAPAPTGISIAASPPNLVVGWQQVSGAAGYAVVRRNPDGTCWSLTPQGTTALSAQEPIPTAGGTYDYQVGVRLLTGAQGLSQWISYVVTPPPPPRTILVPPPTRGTTPTIMSDGPPPVGLTATGTPTTATLSWTAPRKAVNYHVNRAPIGTPIGTSAWILLTAAPITATTFQDVLPDPNQGYSYSVTAYQQDGHFGSSQINFTAPKPTNPSGLTATVTGASVALTWQPVQFSARYTVTGPGISGTARPTGPSHTVALAPAGSNVYRVGSVFDPGGLQTPASAFSSVTAQVQSAPTSCACTKTGGFAGPQINTISGKGLTGSFTHPAGTFRIVTQSVNGAVMFDMYDPQNRSVLSATNPSAWGLSPDNRYFALAYPEVSPNTGSAISVYLVQRGPGKLPIVLNTTAYADGRWGFSAEATMFIVTRLQNAPNTFSVAAYNLLASNPGSGSLQVSETNVYGGTVTTSPCGDRLMYFRWTQLNPQVGQAVFYRRTSFGSSPVFTDWDGSAANGSAGIIAGAGTFSFLVQLTGMKERGTSNTTLPSLQCTP